MKSFNQWLSEDPYVTDPQTNKSLVGRIANVRKKTFDVDIEGKHLIRCAKVNDPNLLFLQDVSSGNLSERTFCKQVKPSWCILAFWRMNTRT